MNALKALLSELPRWASVAVAARCARRVEHYYRESWQEAPQELSQLVSRSLDVAEQTGLYSRESQTTFEIGALKAANAAARSGETQAQEVATAATHAACANACLSVGVSPTDNAAKAADAAISAAAHDQQGLDDGSSPIIQAFISDLELVTEALKRGEVDADVAPSGSFFGPLWPDKMTGASNAALEAVVSSRIHDATVPPPVDEAQPGASRARQWLERARCMANRILSWRDKRSAASNAGVEAAVSPPVDEAQPGVSRTRQWLERAGCMANRILSATVAALRAVKRNWHKWSGAEEEASATDDSSERSDDS